MGASLRDVAKRAGVSVSTASRVLNGHPQVSEEARERVLLAAKELNYDIEALGAARRAREREGGRTIGIIVPDVSTPFYGAILQGVEEEAFARHCDLVLYTTHGRSQENVVERVVASSFLHGLVLVTPRHEEDKAFSKLQSGIPAVVVDHRSEGSGFPHVTVDNLRAAFEATSFLARRGYKRIGFVTGDLDVESARDRLRGYRLALGELGIDYDDEIVLEGDFTRESGFKAIQEYARRGRPMPQVWFCSNDLMAVGAIEALRAVGVSVPGDVGVMGFDDLPVAAYVTPRLTTVRQPIREMGGAAIRMLLRLMEGEELETHRVILETELVVRESC